MFRRIGGILINLNTISYIKLNNTEIIYRINTNNILSIFGIDNKKNFITEKFHTPVDAKNVFEKIVRKVGIDNRL